MKDQPPQTAGLPDEPKGPDYRILFEIAEGHGGFFTFRQAREAGFSRQMLQHNILRAGRFLRVWPRRGIYRLRDYPYGPHDGLWPILLYYGPDAVLSHETALRLHDLSDVAPRMVHVTVPYERRPRQRRSLLPNVRVHLTGKPWRALDITLLDGLRVTSVTRTLVDVGSGGTSPEQVVMALRQAHERRDLFPNQLMAEAEARGPKTKSRISALLAEAQLT